MPREFALLECLLAIPGLVVSAEELLERAWDEAGAPFTSAAEHQAAEEPVLLEDCAALEPASGRHGMNRMTSWYSSARVPSCT
ncbi:winged helix-turn-helix domain-containing protein [Nonomuraea spiralis]